MRYGLMLALLAPVSVFAADPYKEFQEAAAKLRADVGTYDAHADRHDGGFMALVDKCNPPFRTTKFIPGFSDLAAPSDPTKAGSAQYELKAHEKAVGDLVGAVEKSYSDARSGAAACQGRAELLRKVTDATFLAQTKLSDAHKAYKTAVDKAREENQSNLKMALGLRIRSPSVVTATFGAGDAAACQQALDALPGLEASNANLLAKLEALQGSYTQRLLTATAALNAPNSCGGAHLQPASFEGEPPGEHQSGEGTTAI